MSEHDLDPDLQIRLIFDIAGFCGATSSVETSMVELDPARIVFASDYPREIREAEAVKAFVEGIRGLADGEAILAGNVGLLLSEPAAAA